GPAADGAGPARARRPGPADQRRRLAHLLVRLEREPVEAAHECDVRFRERRPPGGRQALHALTDWPAGASARRRRDALAHLGACGDLTPDLPPQLANARRAAAAAPGRPRPEAGDLERL